MGNSLNYPRRVYGVDFSGAKDAGKRIWVARGVVTEDGLRIEECYPAKKLSNSEELGPCLEALQDLIGGEVAAAFGLDFPFGLPKTLVQKLFRKKIERWEDFVQHFCERFSGPNEFRKACRAVSPGKEKKKELKRVTDMESQAPWAPYNLKLYPQTYSGIRCVLAPLVADGSVSVLPMQTALPGKPWILEICPACTLKREELYDRKKPYKGRSHSCRKRRGDILQAIKKLGPLVISDGCEKKVLEDAKGDALDSIVAAFATFRALRNGLRIAGKDKDAYMLEGYIYV